MEKVKLPREVTEAIEAYKNDKLLSNWKGSILLVVTAKERYLKSDFDDTLKDFVNHQTMDTFLQAIVNGYEVEETPEDKVREFYRSLMKMNYEAPAEAVVVTLNHLNIKIQGVNDND